MTITPNPGTDWPDNIQGCTITGRYIDVTGMPIQGKVHFTPSPAALLNADRDVIVVSRKITATLDIDGAFEITVPATDDPDVNPTGWTYEVFEDFTGGRKYAIEAPQNTVIDLADVSPLPADDGTVIVRGPEGPAGAQGPVGPSIETITYTIQGALDETVETSYFLSGNYTLLDISLFCQHFMGDQAYVRMAAYYDGAPYSVTRSWMFGSQGTNSLADYPLMGTGSNQIDLTIDNEFGGTDPMEDVTVVIRMRRED